MLKKSFIASLITLLAFSFAIAQVPPLINYQGRLTDAGGNPVNATLSIQFQIYENAVISIGEVPLWNETQSVTVTDGIFNVLLGSATPIPYPVFDGTVRYLGITDGADPEMTPRNALVSVGYAYRANNADNLDGKDDSDFVQQGEANSISTSMIQDNMVTAAKITPDFVSSVDGVKMTAVILTW